MPTYPDPSYLIKGFYVTCRIWIKGSGVTCRVILCPVWVGEKEWLLGELMGPLDYKNVFVVVGFVCLVCFLWICVLCIF